jgi:hypothetical protein
MKILIQILIKLIIISKRILKIMTIVLLIKNQKEVPHQIIYYQKNI